MTEKEFNLKLVDLIEELNLSDEDVARSCRIALGTVRRWKKGITSPHPIAMPFVFKTLEKLRTTK